MNRMKTRIKKAKIIKITFIREKKILRETHSQSHLDITVFKNIAIT